MKLISENAFDPVTTNVSCSTCELSIKWSAHNSWWSSSSLDLDAASLSRLRHRKFSTRHCCWFASCKLPVGANDPKFSRKRCALIREKTNEKKKKEKKKNNPDQPCERSCPGAVKACRDEIMGLQIASSFQVAVIQIFKLTDQSALGYCIHFLWLGTTIRIAGLSLRAPTSHWSPSWLRIWVVWLIIFDPHFNCHKRSNTLVAPVSAYPAIFWLSAWEHEVILGIIYLSL